MCDNNSQLISPTTSCHWMELFGPTTLQSLANRLAWRMGLSRDHETSGLTALFYVSLIYTSAALRMRLWSIKYRQLHTLYIYISVKYEISLSVSLPAGFENFLERLQASLPPPWRYNIELSAVQASTQRVIIELLHGTIEVEQSIYLYSTPRWSRFLSTEQKPNLLTIDILVTEKQIFIYFTQKNRWQI